MADRGEGLRERLRSLDDELARARLAWLRRDVSVEVAEAAKRQVAFLELQRAELVARLRRLQEGGRG